MSRTEEVKGERRRRNSAALGGVRQRLSVNEEMLDRENFEYRWANDTGSRIHDLTVADDWDVVQIGEQKSEAMGQQMAIQAGTQRDGSAMKTVLLRKRKDYYENDKAESQRLIDELESGLRRGETPGQDGQAQYVPQGGITIGSA